MVGDSVGAVCVLSLGELKCLFTHGALLHRVLYRVSLLRSVYWAAF